MHTNCLDVQCICMHNIIYGSIDYYKIYTFYSQSGLQNPGSNHSENDV